MPLVPRPNVASRPVSAAFWARPFLECAPPGMSRAGFGDLLARFVAYGDWLLGYRLGVMERYDESAFRLMEPFAVGIRLEGPPFTAERLYLAMLDAGVIKE